MQNSFRCLLFLFALTFFSCSYKKYLPAEEKLYKGADVKLVPTEDVDGIGEIKTDVKKLLLPTPNSKFLGLRVKLWIHDIAPTPKRKGLSYWLKYKVGEPPVLFSRVNPNLISQYIESRLFNKGIFHAVATYKVEETETKAEVHYTVSIHKPYVFGKITWPEGDDILSNAIKKNVIGTRLKEGRKYDLDRLNEERKRIDEKLKDEGFFFFNEDYILFRADTNNENKSVNINITLKKDMPVAASQIYHIKEIYLTPDFSLRNDSLTQRKDTMIVDSVHYIYADIAYRPKTILRSVFIHKGETYTRTNHEMTLNRLMGLGVFKFVNIRFTPSDSITKGYLDANIFLTPLSRKSVRAEFEVTSKSNNFFGPALTLSYSNRNAFNGAELLVINLHSSFETQFYGDYKGLFSYEFGPEVTLYVPRFMTPFHVKQPSGYYIPKTKFSVSYNFQRRVEYFDLNTFSFAFGYKWKETQLKEHELDPLDVSYTLPSDETEAFKKLLAENELLRKSFEEQFVIGPSYSFTYNQQVIPRKKNPFYFNTNIATSGNIISLFSKTVLNKEVSTDHPLEVAGTVYSQFVRIDADLRHFRRINSKSRIASRIYAGLGVPYGNSAALPYIKQFFSGGVNSVRAFPARALGPGTYVQTDSSSSSDYFEQGGDIKLEANLEYRFNIISLLKGALFFDAGNIWLVNDNPATPGGKFTSSFMKEVAVGTGLGFRIDVEYFVLRFDFAFPLRKPWLPSEDRWVVDKIAFGDPHWRSDNLLLNFAIGYPF